MATRLLLAAALTAASLPAQAQLAAAARALCFEGRSPVNGRACLEMKASEATSSLRAATLDLESAFSAWRENPDLVQAAREAEAAASASYTRYRDSKCEVAASLTIGNSTQQDFRLSCQYETDMERSAQIRQAAMLLRAKIESLAASQPSR